MNVNAATPLKGRITRQQLAAILFRYTEYRGADTAGRTDLSRFSDSAAVAANYTGLSQNCGVARERI